METAGNKVIRITLLPTPKAIAGVGFSTPFVCLSVFPHDVSKTDASTITKLRIEMFYHDSWNLFLQVKRSRLGGTKNIATVGFYVTVVSAGFF